MSEPLSPLRQLFRAAAAMGVLQIGSMALTFLVGVLLARMLGAEGYGAYALAMAVIAIAGMLTEFGLPILLMREVSVARERKLWGELRGALRWTDRVVLGSSAAMILLWFAVSALFDLHQSSGFTATMTVGIFLIPVVAIAKLRAATLLALGHTGSSQFSVLIVRPGLFALLLALLGWLARDQMGPALAMACQLAAAATAMAMAMLLWRRWKPVEIIGVPPVTRARDWAAAAFPMAMTEGMRAVQGQLAIIVLGILATSSAVGIFRVADATLAICMLPVSLFNVIVGPLIARLKAADDKAELQKVVAGTAFATTLGYALISLPFVVKGGWALSFAFGPDFAASQGPLMILIAGNLLFTMMGPVVSYANMTGREALVSRWCVVSVLTALGAGCALIPLYGAYGAAMANVLGFAAWQFPITWRIWREDGIHLSVLGIRGHMVTQAGSEIIALVRRGRAI